MVYISKNIVANTAHIPASSGTNMDDDTALEGEGNPKNLVEKYELAIDYTKN
jgi:hypothetical protein